MAPEGWTGEVEDEEKKVEMGAAAFIHPLAWKLACLASPGTETRMWDQRHTLASTY